MLPYNFEPRQDMLISKTTVLEQYTQSQKKQQIERDIKEFKELNYTKISVTQIVNENDMCMS